MYPSTSRSMVFEVERKVDLVLMDKERGSFKRTKGMADEMAPRRTVEIPRSAVSVSCPLVGPFQATWTLCLRSLLALWCSAGRKTMTRLKLRTGTLGCIQIRGGAQVLDGASSLDPGRGPNQDWRVRNKEREFRLWDGDAEWLQPIRAYQSIWMTVFDLYDSIHGGQCGPISTYSRAVFPTW